MLVSTFVANAPTIYGDLKITKRKRSEQITREHLSRRMSRPNEWGNLDIEASHPEVTKPERVSTVTSQSSDGSSLRKDWFDHTEHLTKATPLATPFQTPKVTPMNSRRPSVV